MQKLILNLLTFSFISLTISGCSNSHNSNDLDNWAGNYHYEETPVDANAGYAMVMDWNLSISRQNDSCTGILEVNGQQTFLKLKTNLAGDTSNMAVIYDGLIEGNDEQLKNGDTLFTLTKTVHGIKTTWFSLEPRLVPNSPKVCTCFYQTKNSDH